MGHMEPLPVDATPELRDMFATIEDTRGYVPNSLLLMQRKPAIVNAVATLSRAVLRESSDVNSGMKRLVAHVTSGAAGCQYCQAHALVGAEEAGVSEEKLRNVWKYRESDLFSDRERVALDFALAAGKVPNEVDVETVEAVRDHWSDDAFVELLAVISLYGFLNRWNDSMATPLESTPHDLASDLLAEEIWDGGDHVTEW